MGKAQKLFSLDYELVVMLKQEENASGLVNNLVRSHYLSLKPKTDVLESIKIKEDQLAKEKEKLDKERLDAEEFVKVQDQLRKDSLTGFSKEELDLYEERARQRREKPNDNP